jgi:hypothetical protein
MATAGSRVKSADITTLEGYSSARPMTLVRQATTGQTIANNTTTVLTFPTATAVEEYDDLGWHDGSTNTSRITPTIAGRYRIKGHVTWAASNSITCCTMTLLKNGAALTASGNHKPNGTNTLATFGGTAEWIADANGTTDYFEMSANHNSTAAVSQTTNVTGSGYTWLLVELIRAS